jgi:6-phosphogluconolactonase/glucosamine-6-phosphate isomerase/deaminase
LVRAETPVFRRRAVHGNVWLERANGRGTLADESAQLARLPVFDLHPEVLESEDAVGQAMLRELEATAAAKRGDLVVVILGGRGAQALHRMLGQLAVAGDPDGLIRRLRVFTQDALAPMRMDNSFSFVRDFERLLGADFFRVAKSFTSMRTDAADLEAELGGYVEQLEAAGGVDVCFLGHGPEPGGASHLAYIRPGSGATAHDVAGIIPISPNLLDHHLTKFKAGGTNPPPQDEEECRRATHILTIGPAVILGANRIVQSIVDADTAPAKKISYRMVMEAEIDCDPEERARQLDENPGFWIRLHPNVRSLVLPNLCCPVKPVPS